ncbi:MAG: hypothetical protein K6G50_08175 [bacterium]|nr:hypothetical protein [bacterium]
MSWDSDDKGKVPEEAVSEDKDLDSFLDSLLPDEVNLQPDVIDGNDLLGETLLVAAKDVIKGIGELFS